MKKPNILMIVENDFPGDIRVRKEANLLKEFYKVTVIALKNSSEKFYEIEDDIEVFRVPELHLPGLNLKNKLIKSFFNKTSYFLQYFYLTILSSIIFSCTYIKRKYKVIHVHNPPDTLFIVGLLGKIFSVKFIFDHHDLSPELYLTRFSGRKDFAYKILIRCEKLSCKLADIIISTNESYKQIEMDRHHVDSKKIHIVRNNPILSECLLEKNDDNDCIKGKNKKELLFLGAINPQDGLDVLMKILHYLVNDLNRKDFICNIVGDGDSLQSVKQIAKELDLMDYVDFKGLIFEREKIKEYLYLADVCVEPAPDNELNRRSTFIKIMEYMAAGKPTVAFDLKETRYSADGAAILMKSGDIIGFAEAIEKLLDEPKLREELGKAGLERIENELNWEKASLNLTEAYRALSL